MRCKGMASERGWKAPFRSGAQIALRLPQAGPRGPLEPFQGIITSGGVNPSDTDKYFTLEEARREAGALGDRCTLKPIASPAGHRAGDPYRHGLKAEHDFICAAVHEHLLQK
jgi:hypothetical protein